MKTKVDKRPFGYLKDGTELGPDNPSPIDKEARQTLPSGKIEGIKRILKIFPLGDSENLSGGVKRFLPEEVRRLWEAGLGDAASPLVIKEKE